MKAILWNNVGLRSAILASIAFALCGLLAGQAIDRTPQLLLTPQRLRRLKLDRNRQTVRWVNFDNRVQTVPGSPQRGFELALYYAITGEEKRGKEAVAWALAHRCEWRQVALVLDWAGDQASEEERTQLTKYNCAQDHVQTGGLARDELFIQIASGQDPEPLIANTWKDLLSSLEGPGFQRGEELYAACEYLAVVRSARHQELRQDAPQFFSILPSEFLLSLKPERVEHPDWMTHVAALALVDLDPNLESSQYVQGWAMEDREMIREGPGVGYEFFWANPYLPGVGYQNLDPWVYDPAGRLFARSDWSQNACWISISSQGLEEANCPSKWQQTSSVFGHLSLIPMVPPCVQVPRRKGNEVAILWKLRPHRAVSYVEGKQPGLAEADAAGMWRIPGNVDGKVCAAP